MTQDNTKQTIEQNLHRLFETGSHVLFLWKASKGWPIVHVGQNVSQILGFDQSELLNSFFSDLIHPEDLRRVEYEVEHCADMFEHQDYRLKHKNGDFVWVMDRTCVVRNDRDEVEYYLGHLIDISSRKKNEQDLQNATEQLSLVIEGTQLGMWDWNPQTNQVHFNDLWAKMLGYELAEIEQNLESWKSRVHPDDLAACYEDLGRHMRGDVPFYENVHRMKHKNGEWRYILDRGKIMSRDAQGNPIRFTGTHTDISKEKAAEENAKKLAHLKGLFLATMSHEIRTPLGIVLGISEILNERSEKYQDPFLRDQLSMLNRSAQGLLVLVNDILDFSKLEERGLDLEFLPGDIVDECQQVVRLLDNSYRDKGIKLLFHSSLPHHFYSFDPLRLRQIILNLLNNSLKFTHQGEVTLTIEGNGESLSPGNLRFSVRDTGIGIPLEKQKEIFTEFHQVDSSISRRFGGTGLGLAIVKRLVELMGGRIWINHHYTLGAEFVFTINAELSEISFASQPSVKSERILECRPLNILMIDDVLDNRILVETYFSNTHHHCSSVSSAEEGYQRYTEKKWDLVLLDMQMPEEDGYSAAKKLVALRQKHQQQTLIYALSANAFKDDIDRALQSGCDGYFSKPLSRKKLINSIHQLFLPKIA